MPPIEERTRLEQEAELEHRQQQDLLNRAGEGLDYLSVGPDVKHMREMDQRVEEYKANRDLGVYKHSDPRLEMDWTDRVVGPLDDTYQFDLKEMPIIRAPAGRIEDVNPPDWMNARRFFGPYSGPNRTSMRPGIEVPPGNDLNAFARDANISPLDLFNRDPRLIDRYKGPGVENLVPDLEPGTEQGVIDTMQSAGAEPTTQARLSDQVMMKPWTTSEWVMSKLDNANWWDVTDMPGVKPPVDESLFELQDKKMLPEGVGRFASEGLGAAVNYSEVPKSTPGQEPKSLWDQVKSGIAESARTGILSHIGGEGPGGVQALKDLYGAIEKSVQSGGEDVESVFDAAAGITALGVTRGIVRGAAGERNVLGAMGQGGDSFPPGIKKLTVEEMADRFSKGGANDRPDTITLTPTDKYDVNRIIQSGNLDEIDNTLHDIAAMKRFNPKESFIHKTAEEWETRLQERERKLVAQGEQRTKPEPVPAIKFGSEEDLAVRTRIQELSDKLTTFGPDDSHIAGIAEMQREMLLTTLPPEARAEALQDLMAYTELRLASEFPNQSRDQLSLFDKATFDKIIDASNWAHDKYEQLPEGLRQKIESMDQEARPAGLRDAAVEARRQAMRDNVVEGTPAPRDQKQMTFNFRQPLRTAEEIQARHDTLDSFVDKIDPNKEMLHKELQARLEEKFPDAGPGEVANTIKRMRAGQEQDVSARDLMARRDQLAQDVAEARAQGRKMAADRLRKQLNKVNKELETKGISKETPAPPARQEVLDLENAVKAAPEETGQQGAFNSPEELKFRIERLENRLDDPYLSRGDKNQIRRDIKALENQLPERKTDIRTQQKQLAHLEDKLASATERGLKKSYLDNLRLKIKNLKDEMKGPQDLGAARTPEELINYDEPYRPQLNVATEGGGIENNFGIETHGLEGNVAGRVAMTNLVKRWRLLEQARKLQKEGNAKVNDAVVKSFQVRFENERARAQDVFNNLKEDAFDAFSNGASPEWKNSLKEPYFRRLMGGEYAKAVAGDDISTQYDILGVRLDRDKNMPPKMREAMLNEYLRLAKELGIDNPAHGPQAEANQLRSIEGGKKVSGGQSEATLSSIEGTRGAKAGIETYGIKHDKGEQAINLLKDYAGSLSEAIKRGDVPAQRDWLAKIDDLKMNLQGMYDSLNKVNEAAKEMKDILQKLKDKGKGPQDLGARRTPPEDIHYNEPYRSPVPPEFENKKFFILNRKTKEIVAGVNNVEHARRITERRNDNPRRPLLMWISKEDYIAGTPDAF